MDLVSLQGWLDNVSFALLFGAMLAFWVYAAFPKMQALASCGTVGIATANLGIASLLIARWIEAGYFPMSNLYESLLAIAWGVTTVHFIAESLSKSPLVGTVTAPIAMGITAFATLSLPTAMQSAEPLVPALKSNWLMMHVSVMLLSYAALMVGSLLAIAFLFVVRGQSVELKGSSIGTGSFRNVKLTSQTVSQPQAINYEPALEHGSTQVLEKRRITATPNLEALSPQQLSLAEKLDNVSYRIIGLGFPLLTIGIIAGAVWANEAWGSYWSWDPKETWALITWLVFAAYLHARITKGWQGRRPAIIAASGFVVVWICYLGVNLLGKGLHSYGWFF